MMLTDILVQTPRWVFALFATLLWLGARQLLSGTVSLLRATVTPLVMIGLSLYGVGSAFGESPASLLAWAVMTVVLLGLVMQRPLPRTTRYDAASRRFHLAGTAVPLALMMGIFFTKYTVGVMLTTHPDLAHQAGFSIIVSALYGVFTGIFAGRAVRLWRLAIQGDREAAFAA